jgi:hypothetical protein
MSDVYLTVSRDRWTNGLQLSIDTENHGYRIAGPKFNGSSTTLIKHKLNARDVSEIQSYLDAATRSARVTDDPTQSPQSEIEDED